MEEVYGCGEGEEIGNVRVELNGDEAVKGPCSLSLFLFL